MACPSCGSWSVKSDRSLGGRYVCGRCGKPLGLQTERRVRRREPAGGVGWRPSFGRGLGRRGWMALALLGLGATFAAMEQAARRPERPFSPQAPLAPVPGAPPPGRSL